MNYVKWFEVGCPFDLKKDFKHEADALRFVKKLMKDDDVSDVEVWQRLVLDGS